MSDFATALIRDLNDIGHVGVPSSISAQLDTCVYEMLQCAEVLPEGPWRGTLQDLFTQARSTIKVLRSEAGTLANSLVQLRILRKGAAEFIRKQGSRQYRRTSREPLDDMMKRGSEFFDQHAKWFPGSANAIKRYWKRRRSEETYSGTKQDLESRELARAWSWGHSSLSPERTGWPLHKDAVRLSEHLVEVEARETSEMPEGEVQRLNLKLANEDPDFRSSLWHLADVDFQAALIALEDVIQRFQIDPELLVKSSQVASSAFNEIVNASDAAVRLKLLGLTVAAAMAIRKRLQEGWGMAVIHNDDSDPEWLFFFVYRKEDTLAGSPIPVSLLLARALKY